MMEQQQKDMELQMEQDMDHHLEQQQWNMVAFTKKVHVVYY